MKKSLLSAVALAAMVAFSGNAWADILIGVGGPVTGPNAAFGAQLQKGAEQAAADLNAAGGINLNFKKGDLVLIDDHINLLSGNPLSGKNYDELGSRFPDMSEPYDVPLKDLLQRKAKGLGIALKKGVYAAVHGPNLETKAEYRYLKIIGADMVGMSTVPEVIAAVQMQLPCVAVSVITDECDPNNLKPVNIAEIIEVAGKADSKLSKLFYETIKDLE